MIKKRRKKVILVSVNKACAPTKVLTTVLKDAKAAVKDTHVAKIRTHGKSLTQRYLDEKYEK